ncbi:hypothetical protein SBOR_3828 [Sclerotinia borealis F-4128]|uniref:Uncharacterized protein n=1 Tax=Sclerotinia borealis (strain F-4128) TaxID=1432307 RepID=W9CJ03_SCLBF|nr:hypothetical protein SBOR_3828 [Sclerotinia borealis F-4128]
MPKWINCVPDKGMELADDKPGIGRWAAFIIIVILVAFIVFKLETNTNNHYKVARQKVILARGKHTEAIAGPTEITPLVAKEREMKTLGTLEAKVNGKKKRMPMPGLGCRN